MISIRFIKNFSGIFANRVKNVKAIPYKERTAQMSGKRYNKEVKKQLTMSLISDELGAGINEEKAA